jgi:hypothetical protein
LLKKRNRAKVFDCDLLLHLLELPLLLELSRRRNLEREDVERVVDVLQALRGRPN